MNTPKISVVVPVYNAETYLHCCVDSILSQTFTDFELLLINDGSVDSSGKICDKYALCDLRVRVFHNANGGVSLARQCGLENSKGEYIIYVDADDWVEPDMLCELYTKAFFDNADMVICDVYIEDHNRQYYVKQEPDSLEHNIVLRNLFQHLLGCSWNKLVRRACYYTFGIAFLPELRLGEDLYVCTCLLKNPIRIAYLPRAFYHYITVNNPNSITKTYTIRDFDYDVMLRQKLLELLSDTESFEACSIYTSRLIITRALTGRSFTARELAHRCKPYRKQALSFRSWKKTAYFSLWLACYGYANIYWNLQDCKHSICKMNSIFLHK